MPQVKDHIQHLLGMYSPDDVIACPIWTVDDVRGVAQEMGKRLEEWELIQILEDIHQKHDAELGITWTTLRVYVEEWKSPVEPIIKEIEDKQ